ncbi:hypothetical protein ScPMuIL_005815 [Solemya velum]
MSQDNFVRREVGFVCQSRSQDISTPEILSILESDFPERRENEAVVSQEDIRFMNTLQDGVCRDTDGNYQLPLPFCTDSPILPNSRKMAEKRLHHLKKRLKSDNTYLTDYVQFMNGIIEREEAEEVPQKEIEKLAADNNDKLAQAADFVTNNFYVDDGLGSFDTDDDAVALVREVTHLCAKGNLRLHKFMSNSEVVMDTIPESERADEMKHDLFDQSPTGCVLGIEWLVDLDQFHFQLTIPARPLTRRGVLSTVASVYDPLGFLAPFVLLGKQILQELCRSKCDWDEQLPEDLQPKGMYARELMDSNWLTGPDFLWRPELPMPDEDFETEVPPDDLERRRVVVHSTTMKKTKTVLDRLEYFSDWHRAVTAVTVLLKRIYRKTGKETENVRHKAETALIRMIQQRNFQEEIETLQNQRHLHKGSRLIDLDPFLDQEGILRAGGRIQRAPYSFQVKHP